MLKNCLSCKHLKYHDAVGGETLDSKSGYFCEGRDYFKNGDSSTNEKKHLKQLDDESYRNKSKKCCELKVINSEDDQNMENNYEIF